MMENTPAPDEREITILEYLKSLLAHGTRAETGASALQAAGSLEETSVGAPESMTRTEKSFPWFSAAAVLLALTAQLLAGSRIVFFGLVFYGAAAYCLFQASRRQEWRLPLRAQTKENWQYFSGKTWLLFPGLGLATGAFLLFNGQRFTPGASLCWVGGIFLTLWALWNQSGRDKPPRVSMSERLRKLLTEDRAWFFALLLVMAAAAWFSFAQLKRVPPELVSGQVDHIYTVRDILSGSAALSFPRNLVSEPLQYLWGALLTFLTGAQLSFVGLKLAYALANLAAIYYICRLGTEIFDRWVGLTAAFLLSVSFWQIIQTRALLGSGLVLPLGCAAVYYLFSGYANHKANDLLLSAFFVGLGLLTNKIFLIFPLAALVAACFWLMFNREAGSGRALFSAIAQALLLGAVVCVPLLRSLFDGPAAYLAPILSRVSDYEIALSGSPIRIFFGNLWQALGIANWSNRGSWVDGLTLNPGLDLLSAAFFVLGVCAVVFNLRKSKDWRPAALLALYPLLLLPSAFSLAFPLENPSLSRALTALIPVCVLSAVGLRAISGALLTWQPSHGSRYKLALVGLVFISILGFNFRAAFSEYPAAYRQNAWNSSEMANLIWQTELNTGFPQNVWVVGYPYWVDARAVAIEANRMGQDLALMPEQLEQTLNVPGYKLFLIHPLDSASVAKLQELYPTGTIAMVESSVPEKNFLVFLVEP